MAGTRLSQSDSSGQDRDRIGWVEVEIKDESACEASVTDEIDSQGGRRVRFNRSVQVFEPEKQGIKISLGLPNRSKAR
jgi:hypothetical protein